MIDCPSCGTELEPAHAVSTVSYDLVSEESAPKRTGQLEEMVLVCPACGHRESRELPPEAFDG